MKVRSEDTKKERSEDKKPSSVRHVPAGSERQHWAWWRAPVQSPDWLPHTSSPGCISSLVEMSGSATAALVSALVLQGQALSRDLVLLLPKLWHDDSGCCVEWLSAQFQNAVYSLLTMLPWNTSWNNLSHCAMYQATGVAHLPSTPHSAGWTGHAPILVIKVYWPLLSPPQRKRSIIPGSFYPTSIN